MLPRLRENSCFLTVFELGHQLFFLPLDSHGNIGSSWDGSLPVFSQELNHQLCRFSGIWIQVGTNCRDTRVSSLPARSVELGICQPPYLYEPIACSKSPSNLFINIFHWFCFSQAPDKYRKLIFFVSNSLVLIPNGTLVPLRPSLRLALNGNED